MSKGIIALVSFLLTALILVVGVSVVNATSNNPQPVVAAPTQETQLLQQMAERESAYQSLIAEANNRIESLNQEVITLSQATPQVENSYTLSPEAAAQIAVLAVNNEDTLIQLPELVDYQGIIAYEVKMGQGVLYIDANTGEVLFNNVPKRIDEQKAAEIAASYLGGMDPRYAVVKKVLLNGSEIYQVNLNNYIVYLDPYGQVLKAQVIRYTDNSSTSTTNNNTSSSNNSSSVVQHEEEHEDDDD